MCSPLPASNESPVAVPGQQCSSENRDRKEAPKNISLIKPNKIGRHDEDTSEIVLDVISWTGLPQL